MQRIIILRSVNLEVNVLLHGEMRKIEFFERVRLENGVGEEPKGEGPTGNPLK